MKKILSLVFSALLVYNAGAQCTFTPTISGDTMMCPDMSGELTTQTFDSYRWFKRGFSDSVATLIPNATAQVLTINHFDDSGFYFSVEVTDDSCTEMSAEKLVDGWAFLPPFVSTTGTFTVGNDGETVLCQGDTAFYTLGQPYDTSITWYRNGQEIEGANGAMLAVTQAGTYSVEGAPSICPFSLEPIGTSLVVEVVNCTNGFHRPLQQVLQWQWAADELVVKNIPAGVRNLEIAVYALDGRVVKEASLTTESSIARLQLPALAAGTYICKVQVDGEVAVIKSNKL